MKTLKDVTFAPGTAEGLKKVNWEDLGHRWSPGAAALMCQGYQEQWGPWGSFGPLWAEGTPSPSVHVRSVKDQGGHRTVVVCMVSPGRGGKCQ